MVVIASGAAIATAFAAWAAMRSTKAAESTAKILREQYEVEATERAGGPLLELSQKLAIYSLSVETDEEAKAPSSRHLQSQVKLIVERERLEGLFPKCAEFGRAENDEVRLAGEAADEVSDEIRHRSIF
jgi:hypothetical protein